MSSAKYFVPHRSDLIETYVRAFLIHDLSKDVRSFRIGILTCTILKLQYSFYFVVAIRQLCVQILSSFVIIHIYVNIFWLSPASKLLTPFDQHSNTIQNG